MIKFHLRYALSKQLKLLLIIIGCSCSLFCFAKDDANVSLSQNPPLRVITTFTILQDIAQNIAGNLATVESITRPGAEIHDYQPTPQDVKKIYSADLIIFNGLHLEAWFEQFYQDVSHIPTINATDGIKPLYILDEKFRETDIPNPHAWMSLTNAIIYIDNITNGLIKVDPENAKLYQRNANDYKQRLLNEIDGLKKRFKEINLDENQLWLVTSEGAFSYLAKDLGINEAYIYPMNAEGNVKPRQFSSLIDLMKQHKIPVIFSENTSSDRPAKTIANETKAIYGGQLFVDSLSSEDGPVPNYLALLKTTLSTVVEGFEHSQKDEQ